MQLDEVCPEPKRIPFIEEVICKSGYRPNLDLNADCLLMLAQIAERYDPHKTSY